MLEKLREPMDYKWKVQAFLGKPPTQCICVAYIDARQVADKLDEVLGPANWQNKYEANKNHLYCSIGINVQTDKALPPIWVWKTDCGTESDMEAEKGEASDAFKRAAVKWGIGRFLYDLPEVKVKAVAHNGKNHPADESGNILWGKDALTAYCMKFQGKPRKTSSGPVKPAKAQEAPEAPKTEVKGLPAIPKASLPRMKRIWDFSKDKFPGHKVESGDMAKAVYACLGRWPENTADEEQVCNTLFIREESCKDAGELLTQTA